MNISIRIALPLTAVLAAICLLLTTAFLLLGGQTPTNEIAFDTLRETDFDIYLLDTWRNIRIRLTRSPADEYSPAWSPDGEYLAYVYEYRNDGAIYIIEANGRNPRRLLDISPTLMNSSLAWSPDGATLALTKRDESSQGIFLINVDGTNLRRLSGSEGNAFAPTWSQDEQIAFAWSPVANTEIWVMNIAEPDSVHRITDDPLTDTTPAWSPDGREIAFTSDRNLNSDIYLMNPDGSDLRPITYDASRDTMPAWSPDSERIAFISNRMGNNYLFVMQRDGTGIQQLTFDAPVITRPAWRP